MGVPLPIDVTTLARQITEIQRQLEQVAGARRLSSATISPGDLRIGGGGSLVIADGGRASITGDTEIGGNTSIDGDTTMTGNTSIDGDTTIGGNTTISGNTTIGGTTSITGNLSLAAGIIGSSALAQQVWADSATGQATGFSITGGSFRDIAAASVPVPAWASTAVVMATVALLAHDTLSGGYAYLDVRSVIAGVAGQSMIAPVTTGASVCPNQITLPQVRKLAVTPGGSVAVSVQASPSNPSAYPGFAQNQATVSVVVIFMRGA